MDIRWSRRAVSAAALVLAAGRCGGRDASGEEKDGAAAAASHERVDVCDLVPKAEIETIVARKGHSLDEHTIRHELEGNLCRCTGYHNIVKAIAAGAQAMAQAPMARAAE